MIIILNILYTGSKLFLLFFLFSLILMFLYLLYFKFLSNSEDSKQMEEFKTLKNLFIKFSIGTALILPIFLILSRPIPLTKLFDIDDFTDVTHFGVSLLAEDIDDLDNKLQLKDFSEETRLDFLALISDFKVKRSSVNEESIPSFFITLYQNKYETQGKSKLGVLTDAGYVEVGMKKYTVINYEDLNLALNNFLKEH